MGTDLRLIKHQQDAYIGTLCWAQYQSPYVMLSVGDYRKEGRKKGNVYLTMHSTHCVYIYMALDMVKEFLFFVFALFKELKILAVAWHHGILHLTNQLTY